MAIVDRATSFLLAVVLMASVITVSIPTDYDGVSPQESFVVAFGESFAHLEDELNQWVFDFFGVADEEELIAVMMEDFGDLYGDDFWAAAAALEAGELSMSEYMLFVQEFTLAMLNQELAVLGIEINLDAPVVHPAILLSLLNSVPEIAPIMEELTELLTTDVLTDFLGGWVVQMILAVLVEVEPNFIDELLALDLADFNGYAADALDFSLFAEMDYHLGEGTVAGLLAMDDMNERFAALGTLFGDYLAGWVDDNMDMILEFLEEIMDLAMLFADMDEAAILAELGFQIFEVDITPELLEERLAFDLNAISSTVVLHGASDDALNVFIHNTGDVHVVVQGVSIAGLIPDEHFNVVLEPGTTYVFQIAAGALAYAEIHAISITSMEGESHFTGQLGLRFTQNPL